MDKIKRLDAKNVGAWLASASIEGVSKENRLKVLNVCWGIQDEGEMTDMKRIDILKRYSVNGVVPEEKREEVMALVNEMYREEVEINAALDAETVEQLIMSNPKWSVGQSRSISKILQ